MALRKPPLRDKPKVSTLSFLDQAGPFEDQPVQVVGHASIDLFFLSHDGGEKFLDKRGRANPWANSLTGNQIARLAMERPRSPKNVR